MFLHLGGSSVVPAAKVIMILDLRSVRESNVTSDMVDLLRAENLIGIASEGIPKSLTITNDKAYLSPISSLTLKNRLKTWLTMGDR